MRPVEPVLPAMPDLPRVLVAKDQKEYLALPSLRTVDGQNVSRWRLDWRERLQVLLSGNVFVSVWTLGKPLQPMMIAADYPRIIQSSDQTGIGLESCVQVDDATAKKIGLVRLRDFVVAPFIGERPSKAR